MAELDNRFRITKFDGTDFNLWKDKIVNALVASECDESIKQTFKIEDEEDVVKALTKKDEKAKLILMTSINDNILRKLPRKTAKDIWLILKDKYEDKNLQNVIFLRRRFLNSKQEAKESIEDYIDRVELLEEELELVCRNNFVLF
jgi:hypothetical protein